MIKKAKELDFSNKKIAMLIVARPGVGKTTLAESAPRPLLVDLEDGVARVEACYRGDTSVVDPNTEEGKKFESFVKDLTESDLSDYDTVIIDTLGKLVDLLTPVVIRENPINGQRDGKTLSLKGYGAIGAKITEFIKMVKGLNKHIIFIAHCTEVSDGDTVKTRVNIPGATKDKIWDDIDIGGYMDFMGKERAIHFTPTEKYDAKGCHGISGDYMVPPLKSTKNGGNPADNHFLTDLFTQIQKNIAEDQSAYNSGLEDYKKAIEIIPAIKKITNVDELNNACSQVKGMKHGLTSREEILDAVQKKAKELGAEYDKAAKCYVVPAAEGE